MAGARSLAMERAVVQFTKRTGALVVVAAGKDDTFPPVIISFHAHR